MSTGPQLQPIPKGLDPLERKARARKSQRFLIGFSLVAAIAVGIFVRFLMVSATRSDEEMVKVHKAMDEGSCAAIYASAASELKAAVTAEKWQEVCSSVPVKMGSYKGSKRTFIQRNADGSGQFLAVDYDSEFTLGSGHEKFTWRVEAHQLRLVGYRITSANYDK